MTIVEQENSKFQIFDDTYYHKQTPQQVILLLHHARINRIRLRLWYGETDESKDDCGRCWSGGEDVGVGYIGRSTGSKKIPLLVHNKRSLGGPGLLDSCILRITKARKHRGKEQVLWQHPKFHLEEIKS
jgi:hypothetical protein